MARMEKNKIDISYDIWQFLHKVSATQYLPIIIEIILDVFKEIKDIGLRIEIDPEVENSKWVCIDVAVDTTENQALQWCCSYTKRFLEEIPNDKSKFFKLGIDLD
jgi:hypothetical protein